MSDEIKEISITAGQLYRAAGMLDIQYLTQIPRPEAADLEVALIEHWTSEEFDGAVKLLPNIAKLIELCAWPDTYCEVNIYTTGRQRQYLAYIASDNALCLCIADDGYLASLYNTGTLATFFAGEIPVGDLMGTVTMTESEAAAYISQPECLISIAYADMIDSEETVSGRNWIAVYADGTLWQVDEGESVTLRALDKEAVLAELSAIINVKERGDTDVKKV